MIPEIETHVPNDDSPARCRYCDRPFADDTLRSLHEGVAHYDELDADSRTDFAETYEAEQESIRLFRLKALAVLVVLYFGFLWAYTLLA